MVLTLGILLKVFWLRTETKMRVAILIDKFAVTFLSSMSPCSKEVASLYDKKLYR